MKIKLFTLFLTISLAWACSPNKPAEQKTESPSAEPVETFKTIGAAYSTDTIFQSQLSGVYRAYLTLKDALVSSDTETTRVSAAAMGKALSVVNAELLTGAARNDWNTFAPELGGSLRSVATAASLEEARNAFSPLSETMWKAVKAFGAGSEEVYHDYCPMALKNKGAFWLSSGKEIRNPYFGASMLDCGYVKEKLN